MSFNYFDFRPRSFSWLFLHFWEIDLILLFPCSLFNKFSHYLHPCRDNENPFIPNKILYGCLIFWIFFQAPECVRPKFRNDVSMSLPLSSMARCRFLDVVAQVRVNGTSKYSLSSTRRSWTWAPNPGPRRKGQVGESRTDTESCTWCLGWSRRHLTF